MADSDGSDNGAAVSDSRQAPAHELFRDGFLVATSNPKALIFFAAFLSQFMVPGVAWSLQFVVLGGTFVVVEFAYELALAGPAHRVAPWLRNHARAVNRAAGGAVCGHWRHSGDRQSRSLNIRTGVLAGRELLRQR